MAALAVLVGSAVVPAFVLAGVNGSDDCNNATFISGEGVFVFDNSNASQDGVADALCSAFGQDDIDNDIWYCWEADCNDLVRISTCARTGVDTKIAVYDGCGCPSGNGILDCNDDTCNLQSQVSFQAIAGNLYKIRLGTFPGAAGGEGSFVIVCGDPCTGVVCTDPNDPCMEAVCIDGVCTTQPVCQDDGDPCTIEECVDGECLIFNACDDGDPCTIDECITECDDKGASKGGYSCINTPIDCDDGDPCTEDICAIPTTEGDESAELDPCIHLPICDDDDNPCTIEMCDDGVCTTQPVDCDDGDPCTEDFCEPVAVPGLGTGPQDPNDVGYICVNEPIICDDGDPCTINECVEGVCTTQPVDCDDGDPCTEDFCEVDDNGEVPQAVCRNVPLDCDDGDPCTMDACVDGQCTNTPVDCDDGDPCTVDECVGGECSNTPLDCDDGDECTIDECVGGECMTTPIEDCGVPQSQPQSQPASQPSPDCGAGLCGFGTVGLMPFMLLGLGLMRRRVRKELR